MTLTVLILVNICAAFFQPAMQAVVVESVAPEQRLAANSLLQGTTAFLIIIAQGAAAILVYTFSFRVNFLLDAGCYLLSLLILAGMPVLPGRLDASPDPLAKRIAGGIAYAMSRPEIRRVLLLQTAERVVGTYYLLLMYHILHERGEALYVFGLLDIPLGLGGLLAGYLAGRWADQWTVALTDRMLGVLLLAAGAAAWAMFHVGPLAAVAAASFVLAFASFGLGILTVTRLQQLADPAYVSRLFSFREMLTMGVFSASCLAVGAGAEAFGSAIVSWALALWGAASGAVWLVSLRHSSSRGAARSRHPLEGPMDRI